MAEIAPFRGILYQPKAGEPSKLIAPPYDVISDEERKQLEALDPHNCVRLILPQPEAKAATPTGESKAAAEGAQGAGEGKAVEAPAVAAQGAAPGPKPAEDDSRYQRAARTLTEWLADGTLGRDERPALYRYHQTFTVDDREITRRGFIARIRLARFDEGVIMPHERTLSGPKADRLKLMRATRAHFSQIFGLYSDPDRRTDQAFADLEATPPALQGSTSDGVEHRVWRLVDREAQRQVARHLSSEKIYIADGHHRYETMLALRDELRQGGVSPRSAVEYGVMFFCNMDDPGLVVLPTHRVLFGLPHFERADFLRRAREFFVVTEGPWAEPLVVKQALKGQSKRGPVFALLTPGASTVAYLRLRGDLIVSSVPAMAGPRALERVDVALLHGLIFETMLGISREAQAAQTNLGYVKDLHKAFGALDEAKVQAVFLMNPTPVAQVKAVADAGEVMPQKSTFFHPKIASGLVMNPVDPAEEVVPLDEAV